MTKHKKKRTHVKEDDGRNSKVPKSLVMRRGHTSLEVTELVKDLRHMMMPYTALNFKENAKNHKLTLQQYCKHVGLPMGITHMMSFTQNENRLHLRLGRTPEGPTLNFRVHQFSLTKHIQSLQRRPAAFSDALKENPPLVVTNNFGDANPTASAAAAAKPHVKLMRITFQNLFPAINVATVKLSTCRRVVLFHLVDDRVELRHYAIQATAVGVNRRVRKLVQRNRKLPNLNKLNDISDFLVGTGGQSATSSLASDAASDSEVEDDPRQTVELPDNFMGHRKSQKSALKLIELGPRMSLELIKVEKGLGGGDVLYHSYIQKSAQEVASMKAEKEKQDQLKSERRATQEANVVRKRKALEEKREAKRLRKEQRERAALQALREGRPVAEDEEEGDEEGSSDEEDVEEGDQN